MRFARPITGLRLRLRRLALASLCLLAIVPAIPAHAQSDKASAPIPSATLALMRTKGTGPAAPMLLRAYKKDSEIELWKRATNGRYVLIKTYPICRWSGQLGPKTKQGDRQTPEGFYTVTKTQMNPNSSYYLSFDVGYPNAFDKAHGYTGSAVMVHGICASMGCFAMTDAVAGELFAIAREAFAGGQTAFQFQSFPFRMSAANMARYRNDANIAFWRQLKEGSDRFEATGIELEVEIAGGRYAFAPLADAGQETIAKARVAEEVAHIKSVVEDGAAAVRTTYSDGGMHPFWAALVNKGVSVGPISRPEALAFAGQEIVLIPARHKPKPMPESLWTVAIAADSAFVPFRVAGFVPPYEMAEPSFAAVEVNYGAEHPLLVRAVLSEPAAVTGLGALAGRAAIVAQK